MLSRPSLATTEFLGNLIELGTQNNPAYIEIRSGGEPRPIEYRLGSKRSSR